MMLRSGVSGLWDSGYYVDPILQYLGLKDAPTISTPPSPAYAPPIAPQTGPAMIAWTPDQQAEAYAQRGVQYTDDTNYFGSLLQGGSGVNASGSNAIPPIAPKSNNTVAWVLGGVAAVLFLTTISKR